MAEDPWGRAKTVVIYTVTVVWAVLFLVTIIAPGGDSTPLLAAQAVMMMVVGALFVDRRSR